jgi:hypothetical protein
MVSLRVLQSFCSFLIDAVGSSSSQRQAANLGVLEVLLMTR